MKRTLTKILLSRAQSLHAGEGYIFKNLEKDGDTFHQSFSISSTTISNTTGWTFLLDAQIKNFDPLSVVFLPADYPYINYYVINKSREEAGQFYTDNKVATFSFNLNQDENEEK